MVYLLRDDYDVMAGKRVLVALTFTFAAKVCVCAFVFAWPGT